MHSNDTLASVQPNGNARAEMRDSSSLRGNDCIPYKGMLVPLLTEAVGGNPQMTSIRASASLNESSNLCAMFASKLSTRGEPSPG